MVAWLLIFWKMIGRHVPPWGYAEASCFSVQYMSTLPRRPFTFWHSFFHFPPFCLTDMMATRCWTLWRYMTRCVTRGMSLMTAWPLRAVTLASVLWECHDDTPPPSDMKCLTVASDLRVHLMFFIYYSVDTLVRWVFWDQSRRKCERLVALTKPWLGCSLSCCELWLCACVND